MTKPGMKIPAGTPLTVSLHWRAGDIFPVGRLAMRDRRIYFQFDPAFLARPLPLSPFHLRPIDGVLGPFDTPFEGLPGLFADSLPDGWGRLLVDRRARRLRVSLTPLDRLAIVGRHGIGALVYEPATELAAGGGALDLDALAADAAAILTGEAGEVLDRLIALGGSPHGARPKAMIGWSERTNGIIHGAEDVPAGYRPMLVKFAAQNDAKDIGAVEYAYSLMARAAGLRLPRTHLFRGRRGAYFAAERFDRDESERLHAQTLSGLLHADHRLPALDYATVLAAAQRLTQDQREVMVLFSLAAFNVAAHNRDDHAKQFSFLMDCGGAWRAAPAYDLTFSDGINGEHTTTIDGEGSAPGDADLLRLARKAGLRKADAADAIAAVRDAVAKWPDWADEAGLTRAAAREIGQVIAPVTPLRTGAKAAKPRAAKPKAPPRTKAGKSSRRRPS